MFSLSLLIIIECNLLEKMLCEQFYPNAYYMNNNLSPNFIVFIIDEQVITLKTPLTYRVYYLLSKK